MTTMTTPAAERVRELRAFDAMVVARKRRADHLNTAYRRHCGCERGVYCPTGQANDCAVDGAEGRYWTAKGRPLW